jgi:hypothetical protein
LHLAKTMAFEHNCPSPNQQQSLRLAREIFS